MKHHKGLVFLLASLAAATFLSGCGESSKQRQLKEYIAEVKKRQNNYIEPLPVPKKFEQFEYPVAQARDPFEPVITKTADNSPGPDESRPKEELEAFALDSLRMVGTLHDNGHLWAILSDPDGAVHRVTIGKYVGQNYGKIIEVTDKDIAVVEMVRGQDGRWSKRPTKIALVEGE